MCWNGLVHGPMPAGGTAEWAGMGYLVPVRLNWWLWNDGWKGESERGKKVLDGW